MNTIKLKRELLASQWAQRIADFKSSGLPLKEVEGSAKTL